MKPKRPTCYHCHELPTKKGSVFCEECAPAPGALPALIQEPIEPPRIQRSWREWISPLFAPLRHAANVSARCHKLAADLADCAQANLVLRKKCADLKSQRDALQQAYDEVSAENTRCHLEHMQAQYELEKSSERLQIQINLGTELATVKEEWKARAESAEKQLAAERAWWRCPEHGPSCIGETCCCKDLHRHVPIDAAPDNHRPEIAERESGCGEHNWQGKFFEIAKANGELGLLTVETLVRSDDLVRIVNELDASGNIVWKSASQLRAWNEAVEAIERARNEREKPCRSHSYCQKADDGHWFCPMCGLPAPEDFNPEGEE